jgi:hypothetical protein
LRRKPLETEVHRSPDGSGSVMRPGREGHALPGSELQFAALGEFDRKTAVDHQKQLVRFRMEVPTIRLVEYCQPQATIVYAVDDAVW